MRLLLLRGLCGMLLFLTALAVAGVLPGADAEAERIAALVEQLGDPVFAKRQEASRALEAKGEHALPAVRHAAATSNDLEVRRRARAASDAILKAACASKLDGFELVVVEPGAFTMGAPQAEEGRRGDEAQHPVRLTRPFLLGACEVTQDEYATLMESRPSWFAPTGGGKALVKDFKTGRLPVETVTWFDAVEFCNRLSKRDGLEPYYQLADLKEEKGSIKSARVTVAGGNGYRLPTEAEWEFACRGGTTTRFHFGANTSSGRLNCKPMLVPGAYGAGLQWPNLSRPASVATYAANSLRLRDMHGNVAEWCGDWYDKDYYANSPRDDPPGPERGTHRVLRGGSWMISDTSCRSAARAFGPPDEAKDYVGFRVARTPGPKK